MIGVDITRISRFENKSENFIQRVLSPTELIEYYEKTKDKNLFLAARWAIKEALYKADNNFVEFSKITIKKIEKKYYFDGYEISTSSEDDYLIAFVQRKRG